jgi:spore coat polysaccharide biosynthesis protein SpsF
LKTVAIIQARLGSSRLPGKVLLPIGGEPMLARVNKRVGRALLIDEIMVATTNDPSDQPILDFCKEAGINCYQGDAFDVLDRYYQAARLAEADVIVRVTADCPMIDPDEIDSVIQRFFDSGADFAANRLPPPYKRTSPIGMDTEVCSFAALERAWHEADQAYQREHVMPYLYDQEGRFKVVVVDRQPDLGHLRFTVDTPADLQQANEIYAAFGNRDDFTLAELLAENEKNPQWQQEVAQVQHKNLYETDKRAPDANHSGTNKGYDNPVCPLCRQSQAEILEEINSFGFKTVYYLCGNCGFVFQDSRKSQAADPEFYQETYRRIYQESPEPTKKDLYQQTMRARDQAAWLKSLGYQRFARILDIGASSGIFLETFREQFDAEVVGAEPGDAYRALAQAKNIQMFASFEELITLKPERFELVSLMHVLEHLEEPVAALRQIREGLLAEDGLLLVEVPNYYCHDSYELAHLSCFTQHSLIQTLAQAGFELLAQRQHGKPRSKILPLYLTVLAKAVPNAEAWEVVPESNVPFKRKLGMTKRKILSRLNPKEAWLPLEGEL